MKLWAVCGVAVALVAAACGSDDEGGGGNTGGSGGSGGSSTGGSGGGGCPADPQAAVGQSCSVAGQTCGSCADACLGCDIVTCIGNVWKTTAIPPDPNSCGDGGQKNWCSLESMVLCKGNEFCDFPDECGLVKTGYCTAKPTTCDTSCPGVCGCDGKSYCNGCEAHKAGVDVDPNSSNCGASDSGADSSTDATADTGTDAAADTGTDSTTD